jgi:hypothetical protein
LIDRAMVAEEVISSLQRLTPERGTLPLATPGASRDWNTRSPERVSQIAGDECGETRAQRSAVLVPSSARSGMPLLAALSSQGVTLSSRVQGNCPLRPASPCPRAPNDPQQW